MTPEGKKWSTVFLNRQRITRYRFLKFEFFHWLLWGTSRVWTLRFSVHGRVVRHNFKIMKKFYLEVKFHAEFEYVIRFCVPLSVLTIFDVLRISFYECIFMCDFIMQFVYIYKTSNNSKTECYTENLITYSNSAWNFTSI